MAFPENNAVTPNDNSPQDSKTKDQVAVEYEHSTNLPGVLQQLNLSVLISTYQAGKLVVVGSSNNTPAFSFHTFDQVMGVAVARDQIAIGSRRQIHFLNAAHDVAPNVPPQKYYDGCFLARNSFVTGSIHGHDLAFGNEGLWVVNTLFSCLCTLDESYNFFPRWRPPFISQLIDQDRCHLNGLAMENGVPRFVTVLGQTDQPAGWRERKRDGGAILDVPSGEVVCQGLCMPHSPRIHQGKLWVLNSGRGELSIVDTKSGHVQAVAGLPGYTRGLAFYGNYAFVGLSRIRETNIFGGLPIGENPESLNCGLGIVELTTGRTIATLRFKTGVEELFAVDVLPNIRNPKIVGPAPAKGEDEEVWIVPPLNMQTMQPRRSVKAPVGSIEHTSPATTALGPKNSGQTTAQPQTLSDDSLVALTEKIQIGERAHAQGNLKEAHDALRAALEMAPRSADLLNRLGNLYQDMGDQASALNLYQKATEESPDFAPAHQNLGVLCQVMNQPLRALNHFGMAQSANPQAMNIVLGAKVLPIVYENKEQVTYWRNRYATCVDALVKDRIEIDTTHALADTAFYLVYQGENDRDIMKNLGKVYRGVQCTERKEKIKPAGKKPKIGFLSTYFKDHTIGRLNLGRIQHLAGKNIDVSVVSLMRASDSMAQAFSSAADQYVVVPRNVDAARRQIADLKLDALIFTDIGMDAMTQSLCYSRMAPIQAATWGHPVTSGSPMIDYFISSKLAEPEDAISHYTEQLVELPNMGVYYHRPVLSGPKRTKEFFGLSPNQHAYVCPQTAFKFHPDFDQALAGILEADPLAELILIEGRVAAWTQALKHRWERTLPDGLRRVKFLPTMPNPDFLQLLACADVLLDPFPFCGGNSSYEAFAVGTPVVTLPGRFLRGRLTYAMLQRMGITSLHASSVSDYVRIAVELGCDPSKNQACRKQISESAGVLFDNPDDASVWESLFQSWIG